MNLLACPGFSIDVDFGIGSALGALANGLGTGIALAVVPAALVSAAFVGLVLFVLAGRRAA